MIRKIHFILICIALPLRIAVSQPGNAASVVLSGDGGTNLLMVKQFPHSAAADEQTDIDLVHYKLNITIHPDQKEIDGKAILTIQSTLNGLSSVVLDLNDLLSVDKVEMQGTSLAFNHSNNQLTLTLPQSIDQGNQIDVSIEYHGPISTSLQQGPFVIENHSGTPIIYNFSNGPYWFPCHDQPSDKATSETNITVPKGFVVASNGTLVATLDSPDSTTYMWSEKYPVSTYLMSIAVTNYVIIRDWYVSAGNDSMELTYYVYPEHKDKALTKFGITKEMIQYFASIFGEYPFLDEKYGMAEVPIGVAGEEHQTIASVGDQIIPSTLDKNYFIAHELAHQWWGDYVTLKDWAYLWLNEGFASYAEALWDEHINGMQSYHAYMDKFATSIASGTLYSPDNPWSELAYKKGAWVLHMLRHIVGEQHFWEIFPAYGSAFAYGNASTEDFQHICESVSGMSLGWFFQEWIYGYDRPSYYRTWHDTTISGKTYAAITVSQEQSSGLFTMPLDVRVTTAGGEKDTTVWDSVKVLQFQIPIESAVQSVEIDPDNWVLKFLQNYPSLVNNQKAVYSYELFQNYPNPFNPTTTIQYDIPHESIVTLTVFNILGQQVARIAHGVKKAGEYRENFNAAELSSGLYFYRIEATSTENPTDVFTAIKKMVVLK